MGNLKAESEEQEYSGNHVSHLKKVDYLSFIQNSKIHFMGIFYEHIKFRKWIS